MYKNPMLYQVEGVTGKDLIVKPTPGHNYSIRNLGHEMSFKLMHLLLCIVFILKPLILKRGSPISLSSLIRDPDRNFQSIA